jgi:murein DD-endopeptidase
MANGTVTKYAHDTTFGNYMIISHDNGYTTKYCFLSEQIVKVGDIVSSGQSIALSGNDPVNRLNQLHFEIALNGSTVDPSTMLKNISVGSSIVAGSN